MDIERLRTAFRFVRRWNLERGYWSRADALEFELMIGESVTAGDQTMLELYRIWLDFQRRDIEELTSKIAPACRAMRDRVLNDMREAQKAGV